MVKKFTANCDFGGQRSPVDLYVGSPALGSHPLGFQSKWLASKRGTIPPEIMTSFGKLVEIAERNRVPFEDLCEYVIDELRANNAIVSDTKKATEISRKD
ncbi:MAG: DUF2610 domain-containing protein [Alphaproteobacteria bacterium]|nr:DUF2610 domain-containing protein [Alphaproteobacteria bacterium]